MRAGTARRVLPALGLALVVSCPAYAGQAAPGRCGIDPSLVLVSSLDAREELLALDRSSAGSSGGEHAPTQMFLLSLAVPGSGQLVQGQKRGFVYLAAEAAFWTGFFILNGDGLDKRDAYEDFADDRWDYEGYAAYYDSVCVACPDCDNCRPMAERYSQEFYEDIGKYEVYWEYWRPESDWQAVRDMYWEMRKESNRDLRNARYFVTAAFLNHLVSAVDSFLSARGGRSPGYSERDLSLEFDMADAGGGLSCAVVMRY